MVQFQEILRIRRNHRDIVHPMGWVSGPSGVIGGLAQRRAACVVHNNGLGAVFHLLIVVVCECPGVIISQTSPISEVKESRRAAAPSVYAPGVPVAEDIKFTLMIIRSFVEKSR